MIAAIIGLLLAVSLPSLAQEKLTAVVDKNTVRVGETLTLTITFSGAASGVPEPALAGLERLQVVGGPYLSTNLSISNGRAAATASFSYAIRAKEQGQGRIGEARLKYKGKDYTSAPIAIAIQSATAAPSSKGTRGNEAADVFIRVFSDKTEAYLGEQITLTYKIYFAAQISNPEFVKMPRATGFWVEDISNPNPVVTDEVINGKAYRTAVIRKSALFPSTVGELEVEPMVVRAKIERRARRRSRDPFDIFSDPFFQLGQPMEPVELESPSLKLQAKPLPQSGAPADFAGVIGNYQVRATLDRDHCQTNDAVTLRVTIEGIGNVKTLPEPAFVFPPDIEHYEPKSSEQIRREPVRISGSKTFEYVLIPRAPGLQVIPPAAYSFFDPQKERYVTAATPELRLSVEKGEGSSAVQGMISVAAKRGVETIGTDIAFVKTRPGRFVSSVAAPHQSIRFWLMTGLPWAGLALVVGFRRKTKQDESRFRYRGELKRAAKQLALADHALKKHDLKTTYHWIESAVEVLAGNAVGRSGESLTSEELSELWTARQLDPELLQRILDVRHGCDFARFASQITDSATVRQTLDATKQILVSMNRMRRETVAI